MSGKKEYQRHLQPIVDIIQYAVQLNQREIVSQEIVSCGIVGELILSDVVAKIQSQSTLRVIIYQLIMHYCQSKQYSGRQHHEKGCSDKMGELLLSIKEILGQLTSNNQNQVLKSVESSNVGFDSFDSKSTKNKLKILASYFNQYCGLLGNKGKKMSQPGYTENEKQEALIDQLEILVYKKEELLKKNLSDTKVLEKSLEEVKNQLAAFRVENIQMRAQITKLKLQNEELRGSLGVYEAKEQYFSVIEKNTAKNSPILMEEESQDAIHLSNYLFHQQPNHPSPQTIQDQLFKLLASQALTIEAFLT